jgi:hypothetical protein
LYRYTSGSLKLLDMTGQMPNLRRVPGVKTWEVWWGAVQVKSSVAHSLKAPGFNPRALKCVCGTSKTSCYSAHRQLKLLIECKPGFSKFAFSNSTCAATAWDKFGKHDTFDGPEEKNKLHATMFPDAESDALPLVGLYKSNAVDAYEAG